MNKRTVIIGIGSGIGGALAKRLWEDSHEIIGTLRNDDNKTTRDENYDYYELDLASQESIISFTNSYPISKKWDNLVICPATLEPIGNFETCNIKEWLRSYEINFTSQVILLHKLMRHSRRKNSKVLFFAGGGTNSAPKHFSCYTTSKISLIKLVELLDNEIKNIAFTILGPGWVNTKIHHQTLKLEDKNEDYYNETVKRINENKFVDMDKVVESIIWILNERKEIVGGRNFSTAHDMWGTKELHKLLLSNPNAYKLRRYANEELTIKK